MKTTEDMYSEERKEYFNFKKTLLKYWRYRYSFLIILAVLCVLALAVVIIVPPAYEVTASITVLDEERGGSKNDIYSVNKLFYSGRDWLNTENEVEVLKSTSLIERVVSNLGMFVEYKSGGLLKKHLPAADSPIQAVADSGMLERMASAIDITVAPATASEAVVTVKTEVNGDEWEKKETVSRLPAAVATPFGRVTLSGSMERTKALDKDLHIRLSSPVEAAMASADRLSVSLLSRTSSVVSLEYKCPDRQEGMNFLAELVKCYNQNANADKNRVACRTQEFLQKRIAVISEDLDMTDLRLEEFKRQAGLTDMSVDTREFREENSMYDKDLHEVETQLGLLQHLKSFMQKAENRENLVPSDIGLRDVNLSNNINAHNQLVLDYQRLSRTSSDSNPVTANMRSQITTSYDGLLATLESSYTGMLITKNELERKTRQYSSRISNVPANERVLTDIMRQQENKQSLYLDLLKKLEENTLMLDAVTENAKFIDLPYASANPTSPSKKILLLATLFMALVATTLWMIFRELFSTKVIAADEIGKTLKKTRVVGKIPFSSHIGRADVGAMVTQVKMLMDDRNQKGVCLFSTHDGDGKTFVAASLAGELGRMGKKTLLLRMNLRDDAPRGNGTAADEWVVEPSAEDRRLQECIVTGDADYLREIISSQTFAERLENLFCEYDYVVIDSVSVEHLPNTLQLLRLAGYGLYVCRLGHTRRKSIEELAAIDDSGSLPAFDIVVNYYK